MSKTFLVTSNSDLFNWFDLIGIDESLSLLKQEKSLQMDSETTGVDPHLANLLCVQLGHVDKDWQIIIDCTTIDITLYKEILETKTLIGHNLKFDLQFLYNYKIIPRKVWDTMIIEQLLYLGYPKGMISYSLASVAFRRLNITIDKSIRENISSLGLTKEVIDYAAADVLYLTDIARMQYKECYNRECIKGAELENNVVPAMAYLEWCGIKLDENKWKEKMRNDKKNLEATTKALNDFIINTPSLKQFTYINNQGDLFEGFNMEPQVKVNWSSSKQVVEVAKILGFNTIVQDKKTGEDKNSVLEKHLAMQKCINDEFLKLYFAYQEYAKVVSSFGQGHLDSINPITGRLHTVYHQLGASSSRMSCGSNKSNEELERYKGLPKGSCNYKNIQQLPSDEITRSCFVAEENNLFCSCDFSALESRLGADIYDEHSMIEEFLHNSGDIHSLVAKACFPELKDKTTKEIKTNYAHLRKKAKPIGFSQQFGGSAMAIAQSLGCSLQEAETIAKAYLDGFPGIAEFKKKGSELVRKNGYVLMCKYTGHKMYWWDHKEWLERQESFTNVFWEDYRLNHKGTGDFVEQEIKMHFKAASKWDRMALNSPTQATGCIIIKDAITTLFNYIIDNNLFNIVKLVAVVHDECNIEYPKDISMDIILQEIMEKSAAKYCKSLPIPAEASVGLHWIH